MARSLYFLASHTCIGIVLHVTNCQRVDSVNPAIVLPEKCMWRSPRVLQGTSESRACCFKQDIGREMHPTQLVYSSRVLEHFRSVFTITFEYTSNFREDDAKGRTASLQRWRFNRVLGAFSSSSRHFHSSRTTVSGPSRALHRLLTRSSMQCQAEGNSHTFENASTFMTGDAS